jgi:type II secretory pathway pseudopilin PulG
MTAKADPREEGSAAVKYSRPRERSVGLLRPCLTPAFFQGNARRHQRLQGEQTWNHSESQASMKQPLPIRHRCSSEEGYILLAAIFMLAILTLALSIAAPAIARQIQLDRERETLERGKQYRRAIQLYFRKFHAYPPSVDALVMTNNIRFLRKRYTDPMTSEDDWRPILFGHNQTPTAMGFFGQPLNGAGPIGASALAGTGPSGGNAGTTGSIFSSGSDSTFNSGPSSPAGGPGTSAGAGSAIPSQGSSSETGLGSSEQTFGGAGIIGFSPGCARQSILIYKKKDRYDEWEFTYDPLTDPALARGNALTGPPLGSSVVGTGCGSYGTGPVISPCPSSPTPGNALQ